MKNNTGVILLLCGIPMLSVGCIRLTVQAPEGVGGSTFLIKSACCSGAIPFFRNPIQVGNCDGKPGKEIATYINGSVILVDPNTCQILEKFIGRYSARNSYRLIDIAQDGNFEFLYLSFSSGEVKVHALDGSFLWVYGRPDVRSLWDVDVGDLDCDGRLEIYVTASDDLHCLDENGAVIWKKGGSTTAVEVLEPDGSNPGIVISQHYRQDDSYLDYILPLGRSRLVTEMRDHRGTLLTKHTLQLKGRLYAAVRWPTDPIIVTTDSKRVYVFNLDGEELASAEVYCAPRDIRAVSVVFDREKPPFLAVLCRSHGAFGRVIGKAMLFVFSAEGQLVYREGLNSTSAMAVWDDDDSETQLLLVGEGKNLWMYRAVSVRPGSE